MLPSFVYISVLLSLFSSDIPVFASKLLDDELVGNIVADSALDKNIKILHFTGNYDTLKHHHKGTTDSSSVTDKLIPEHNKVIFKIQLKEPLSNNDVIHQLCKAVAEHLDLPLDNTKVSKYEVAIGIAWISPANKKLKYFSNLFLDTLHCKIQLNEPLSNNDVIRQLCKAVAEHLDLPLDNIKVSKYEPSTGKVKMFFLYTLKGENDTDILELRPANEILTQLKQKRLSNVGTAIRIVSMRHGMGHTKVLATVLCLKYFLLALWLILITGDAISFMDVPLEYSSGRKLNIQSIFSDKNWEAWQLAVIIAVTLFAIFCVFIVILFLSSRHISKDKVGPIEEPRHVVVQPILRPSVAGVGVIQPENRDRHISEAESENTPSPSKSPMRTKGKGLLERRGSNASLTLDLNRSQENIYCGTPPKECSAEEYLQSAGKRMTRRQLRSSLRDVKALHSEFWEIPMNHPEKVEVAGSGTKNRYKTILPNESTRVHLYERNDDPLSSYINANYVRGYGGEMNAYIATQGPMPHTVNDFWLMVWKERSSIIVMITKLKEKMKVKCEPYIPDYQSYYNDIEVTVTRVIPCDGYTVRELILRRGSETHSVYHFWYTSWPDHKTPDTAKQLISMALEVEALRQETRRSTKGPIIVHCSAGIGRTGCFIAASIGIQQLLEENSIDVLAIVCSLRLDRGGMVQTAEQYEFVHQALSIFESTLPEASGD